MIFPKNDPNTISSSYLLKNAIFSTITFLCIYSMGCCPCLDIPHADHSFSNTISSSSRKLELNPEHILKTSNWLQRISDDTYVSDLSIPGTHNSATYASKFYQVRRLCQCQVMSIYEQL